MGNLARGVVSSKLAQEGVRRAIKFSSRRDITSPQPISKGQRFTPLVVAGLQAAYLKDITISVSEKTPFKKYKDSTVDSYGNEVFKEGWEKSELGKRLLEAAQKGDYSNIFPDFINVDQRFTLPKNLYMAFLTSDQVTMIVRVHYFEQNIEKEHFAASVQTGGIR